MCLAWNGCIVGIWCAGIIGELFLFLWVEGKEKEKEESADECG